MKIKAVFDSNHQLLAWIEVTENPIDFIADDGEQVYELEVDSDFLEKEFSEQMEKEIREALKYGCA